MPTSTPPPHPRTIGWLGTTALAMGGSNQMVFLIGALIIGQGSIPGQGSAAVLCLVAGLILGWMAMPGWTELILMWPNRVGGIAATCGEAFRPYAPLLGNLTGIAYWWGWVPTCGLCALLSASAIHAWFLPGIGVSTIAIGIVLFFQAVNLAGVKWITRLTIPIGITSGILAFLSAVIPVWSGTVDWHQSMTFHLTVPFPGVFGKITSFMAGLYLVGFAAPAFEAAACHVGETIDHEKNVPRAMYASAIMATLYFLVLPVIWLGTIGSGGMAGNLAETLGPTFAPLFGGAARAAAASFMVFNMFNGTIAPLTGVCRTLSQLSEDGLIPKFFSYRVKRTDAPWVASGVTAACAIGGILIGDPVWFIAAANLTYLIGIALPSIAVWLLRRDQPDLYRPYRASNIMVKAGVVAAIVWGLATVLGFEQFGLPTVIFGVCLAYSGSVLYAWRKWSDHRESGKGGVPHSLHVKLTAAMMAVLLFDTAGYYMAVRTVGAHGTQTVSALEDVFVLVALLTIAVGLIIPGMIAHSAVEVMQAARKLANGTLADFSRAMESLAAGNLDDAHARVDITPVVVHTRDEVGQMAASFNTMQEEVKRAAIGLDGARDGLREARRQLEESNANLELRVSERTEELQSTHEKLVDAAWRAGTAEVAIGVLHNVGNVLNSINVGSTIVADKLRNSRSDGLTVIAGLLREHESDLADYLVHDEIGRQLPMLIQQLAEVLAADRKDALQEVEGLTRNIEHVKQIVQAQQSFATPAGMIETFDIRELVEDAIKINLLALNRHRVAVSQRFDDVPLVSTDRHKALQILVNIISNAKWAVKEKDTDEKSVSIDVRLVDHNSVCIEVADNGIGIDSGDIPRLFEHGFTRRAGGHGFGLHSSAVAAQLMGGSLYASSEGVNKGARFVLTLPIQMTKGATV